MRISDWSSDVCSSDLITPPGLYTAGHERHDRPVDHPCHHRSDGGRRLCRPSLGDARLSLVASQEPPRAAPRPVREKRLVRRNVRHTLRSEEHTSELQSLMRISYAVFCLQKKKNITN